MASENNQFLVIIAIAFVIVCILNPSIDPLANYEYSKRGIKAIPGGNRMINVIKKIMKPFIIREVSKRAKTLIKQKVGREVRRQKNRLIKRVTNNTTRRAIGKFYNREKSLLSRNLEYGKLKDFKRDIQGTVASSRDLAKKAMRKTREIWPYGRKRSLPKVVNNLSKQIRRETNINNRQRNNIKKAHRRIDRVDGGEYGLPLDWKIADSKAKKA
tara:strand:+ start:11093 stop:11734 length:642 start_codon:yes stop_codon:yes gene_type:complete